LFSIILYIMPSSGNSSPVNTPGNSSNNSSINSVFVDASNTIIGDGYVVQNTQGTDSSGNEITNTTFETTDSLVDFQVFEDLSGIVEAYYDNTGETDTALVLKDIQDYGSKIQCSDFHGKGTIDDYAQLFQAAAKIANETKQMQLDIDIDGFNEFADAADELSKLFTSFIVKLENVSIIDDMVFLRSVSAALKKIWNLSEVFGKFKQTILATSSVQLPKSTHDTKVVLESVIGNVNCAMKYISHFVDASSVAPEDANLSPTEKGVIDAAVATIDNWNVLCEQGVSIAMSNNPDIQYIKTATDQLKNTTNTLKTATNQLKFKLAGYRLSSA
jgi:hypothetical protein